MPANAGRFCALLQPRLRPGMLPNSLLCESVSPRVWGAGKRRTFSAYLPRHRFRVRLICRAQGRKRLWHARSLGQFPVPTDHAPAGIGYAAFWARRARFMLASQAPLPHIAPTFGPRGTRKRQAHVVL